MDFIFPNLIFGQRKHLPAGSGSYPSRRHLIARGLETGRVWTALMSPLAGLRDLQSALPAGNNRSAEEPKPGQFGSQNWLSGQLHHKHTRNTPPCLPASHSRFWKRMEGWRSSPQIKSKTKCKNRFAEQYAEDNFHWSEMFKHLPEQIRGPVPNKKERE